MLGPGLHPLECSRCGAPLAPRGRTEVTCQVCGHPHLFVAPGAAPGGSPPVSERPRGGGRPAAPTSPAIAAILVGVIVAALMMGGAVMFLSRGPRARSSAPSLPADVPLLAGDQLTVHLTETSSASAHVLATEGGRVSVLAAGQDQAVAFDRARFTVDAFASPQPGDIGVARRGASWERAEVITAEPGGQLRIRGLGAEHTREQSVGSDSFLRLQPSRGQSPSYAPLPAPAPLLAGDVILAREQSMLVTVRVVDPRSASDTVLAESGVGGSDGRTFSPYRLPPAPRPRATLMARLVTFSSPTPEAGTQVVFSRSGGMARGDVVRAAPGHALVVRDDRGQEETVLQTGLYVVRPAR